MSSAASVNNGQTVYVGIADTIYLDVTPAYLTSAAGVTVAFTRPTVPDSTVTLVGRIVGTDVIAVTWDGSALTRGRWVAVATVTNQAGQTVPYPTVLEGRPVITVAESYTP